MSGTLIEVRNLRRVFDVSKPWLNRVIEGGHPEFLKAVDGVSFDIKRGETFALVGESGSGKTTVARMVVGLLPPSSGEVVIDGVSMTDPRQAPARRRLRRRIQMVFQDPYASLNPRYRVTAIVAEPIRAFDLIQGERDIKGRVGELLSLVGLHPDDGQKFPHEFSGGQRQRIGIARALILNPKIVICDEPVSALDVSIRAQIINLLLELKESLGLSYIMISHDLGVVEHMSDRVAVMYLGRIVETGGWRDIFERPAHPYTQTLIAAIPDPLRRAPLATTKGELPNPLDPPDGCAFSPRCRHAEAVCQHEPRPSLETRPDGHAVRCWRADEIAGRAR